MGILDSTLPKLALEHGAEPVLPGRVVAGAHPSPEGIHVGHYFGSVLEYVHLQHEYPGDAYCVVADYHALADRSGSRTLGEQVRSCVLDHLALGVDPSVSVLYRQSDVPQVCELMWILACTTHKDRLDRTLNKRWSTASHGASLGTFLYPALQAADVLALRATDVALGAGQEPALELIREIAGAFNRRWHPVFPLPYIRKPTIAEVRGIDGRKMRHGRNALPVFWSDDEDLARRVNRIVTSPNRLGEPVDPDSSPLLHLYQLVVDSDSSEAMKEGFRNGMLGYRDAKRMLFEALRDHFEPARERRRRLESDPGVIDDILAAGASRAREEVAATIDAVREEVGIDTHRSWRT